MSRRVHSNGNRNPHRGSTIDSFMDLEAIREAIESPPEPTEKLKKAFRRARGEA